MNIIPLLSLKMLKDLLKKVADLCYKASEEVYDDDKENGTANILNLCDKLQEAIDEYVLDLTLFFRFLKMSSLYS